MSGGTCETCQFGPLAVCQPPCADCLAAPQRYSFWKPEKESILENQDPEIGDFAEFVKKTVEKHTSAMMAKINEELEKRNTQALQ